MGVEIERKFLVADESWRDEVVSRTGIRQGYLALTERCSVRVRISGDQANLNFKGLTIGIRRSEFEYPIPLADAEAMLEEYCGPDVIEKHRHLVDHAGHRWEVDEFAGDNAGLVVAELELGSEDEAFEPPGWLGEEVTGDLRYYNVALVQHPYRSWTDE
jgi:adenylate cyclase